MKKVVEAALLMPCAFLCAMEVQEVSSEQSLTSKIVITEELITQYKNDGFTNFIATKKIQKYILNGGSWVPGFDSLLKEWNNVKPDEARIFLNRIFDKEKEFKSVVENFATNNDNIAYIQSIFDKLSEEDIKSKSNGKIVAAIKGTQHAQVKTSNDIGIKEGQKDHISDNDFFNYAACNLMALHAYNKLSISASPRGHRRRNSKSSTGTIYG